VTPQYCSSAWPNVLRRVVVPTGAATAVVASIRVAMSSSTVASDRLSEEQLLANQGPGRNVGKDVVAVNINFLLSATLVIANVGRRRAS